MITPAIGLVSVQDSGFSRPPLALMVTGQEWVSLSMETLLAPRGFAVLRSYTGLQALQRVQETPPDLLIVDRDLRDIRGVELCIAMRETGTMTPSIPLMLLSTGIWPAEERIAALRAGAWEICSLPMNGEELVLKLETWVRAKLASDVAREEGLLDPDTGLYNVRGVLKRLAELGAGANRHRRPLACVVLSPDLPEADGSSVAAPATATAAAVQTLAAKLRSAGRASDSIGRLSSTEFVVVAPDTDEEGAEGLTVRLRRAFEAGEQGSGPDSSSHVRFGSYAVADFREASIAPPDLLIRAAEALRS
ncbi:MAG TPA: response regulator [Gemmatimonadaceae bacterium]|nr:response regulator [Gemmatimonadaceae bacterium]